MPLYQLKTEQFIPATMQQVWDFMSSPRNLSKITPPHMGFKITNEPIPERMYAGMIISYKVSPLLGIKMNWVTEITHVEHLHYFVDEQRAGPYSIWHHEHFIEEAPGGVIMRDIVSYQPPLGPLGAIANSLFIKAQLKAIFGYRFKAVDAMFPPK